MRIPDNRRHEFADWFTNKFLDWQKRVGRKTVGEWAEHCGIAQPSASRYLNGEGVPDGINLMLIALRCGPDAYKVAGVEPPIDHRAIQLITFWLHSSNAKQNELWRMAESGAQSAMVQEQKGNYVTKRKKIRQG